MRGSDLAPGTRSPSDIVSSAHRWVCEVGSSNVSKAARYPGNPRHMVFRRLGKVLLILFDVKCVSAARVVWTCSGE